MLDNGSFEGRDTIDSQAFIETLFLGKKILRIQFVHAMRNVLKQERDSGFVIRVRRHDIDGKGRDASEGRGLGGDGSGLRGVSCTKDVGLGLYRQVTS
jgi:hypothetical protein